MSSTTVAEFANELKKSTDTLLEQLKSAGVPKASAADPLTDADKHSLLSYLQNSHGTASPERKKITLVKKQTTEIKQADATGKARTIQVEVRKKRTFVRRDDGVESTVEVEEQDMAAANAAQAAEDAELARREEEASRQAELIRRQEEELAQRRREREEQEARAKAAAEQAAAQEREAQAAAARKAQEQVQATVKATPVAAAPAVDAAAAAQAAEAAAKIAAQERANAAADDAGRQRLILAKPRRRQALRRKSQPVLHEPHHRQRPRLRKLPVILERPRPRQRHLLVPRPFRVPGAAGGVRPAGHRSVGARAIHLSA